MGIIEYLAKNNLSKEQAAYSAYGSLFDNRFGDTNNYSESEIKEKLVNSGLAKELEEFYGGKLVPITLDLTSLNGSKSAFHWRMI